MPKLKLIPLSELKKANPNWFDGKRFFGDVLYLSKAGKLTGKTYLIRLTSAWSDMFGCQRVFKYRINTVDYKTHHIGDLLPDEFDTILQVKTWLESK